MYKYLLLGILVSTLSLTSIAQSKSIPMDALHWDYNAEAMQFKDTLGASALHINGQGIATIQSETFKSGTISFDYYATGRGFCGIYFRRQAGENRSVELESEFFYLRSFKIDNLIAPGSVQYAPITKGTNLWDLLHDYEANALIKSNTWNKVKLVISDAQMKCYLNDEMVLWIPELLGPSSSGIISIEGNGLYSNMIINKGNIEDLSNSKGADIFAHDVRYLRDWKYSPPQEMAMNSGLSNEMFPDSNTVWTAISSGRAGLINLTEEVGSPFTKGTREMLWLNTTIDSELNQVKQLSLGFSDDIWVYVNGQLLHIDKNTFARPIAKQPNGRLHIENATINLPLREGENEIAIAIASNFFGWGLVARLDNMNGITDKMSQ